MIESLSKSTGDNDKTIKALKKYQRRKQAAVTEDCICTMEKAVMTKRVSLVAGTIRRRVKSKILKLTSGPKIIEINQI